MPIQEKIKQLRADIQTLESWLTGAQSVHAALLKLQQSLAHNPAPTGKQSKIDRINFLEERLAMTSPHLNKDGISEMLKDQLNDAEKSIPEAISQLIQAVSGNKTFFSQQLEAKRSDLNNLRTSLNKHHSNTSRFSQKAAIDEEPGTKYMNPLFTGNM